ncbi:MAG: hypothetical protein EP299_00925 [Acidobacteria bacterium]|nr:MAG: hypothetical protein EP299_00925 [Acidobacteriota bacterium]
MAASTVSCNAPLAGNYCVRGTTFDKASVPGASAITVTEADLAAIGLAKCKVMDINVGVSREPSGRLGAVSLGHGSDKVLVAPSSNCGGLFDDEGWNSNTCLAGGGPVAPFEALGGFDGRDLVGRWALSVDGGAGVIDSWGFAADVQCSAVPSKAGCDEGPTTLCLGDRFRVEVSWRDQNENTGDGQAIALTNDTGTFWFFNPNNLEMMLKVLNGCPSNNHFWVFAGGLTNVEVNMTVTDTTAGVVRTYKNPLKTPFQPIQDTSAFPTCDGEAPPEGEEPPPPDAGIFCDRELCATDEELRQECIQEFAVCLETQELNDDECVILALLTCDAD